MRSLLFTLILFIKISVASAQEHKLYNPAANAGDDITAAVTKAASENKFVLIQAGGNWCGWCIEFARFSKADKQIDSVINHSFVLYHLNWSKENENKQVFAQYGYPQRFGFPVFIVLNQKGERIHTQDSEYLEDGKKSYDRSKVKSFLSKWSPDALAPSKF